MCSSALSPFYAVQTARAGYSALGAQMHVFFPHAFFVGAREEESVFLLLSWLTINIFDLVRQGGEVLIRLT